MAKKIDLSKLSLAELKSLANGINKAISQNQIETKKAALKDAEAVAQKHGFSLKELMGKTPAKAKAAAPAKFRHPENSAVTWSGRGRQPVWYKDAIAAGVDPKKLTV